MKLRVLPLVALAVMALLGGCSGDDGQSGNAADQQNEATADATAGATAGAGDAAAAGVENINPEDVVVEQTVESPGNPQDRITLGVPSLTVEDQVMVLRLVVIPQFASVSDSETLSLFETFDQRPFRPRLIDTANLKEYEPLQSDRGLWISDGVDVRAVNGSPMLAWAYFAAPEDAIDTIDVRVSDAWLAFTDVPISR